MHAFSVSFIVATALVVVGTPLVAQQDSVAGPRFREAFASLPEGRDRSPVSPETRYRFS